MKWIYFKLIFSIILSLAGLGLIFLADWRIAIGVLLIGFSVNIAGNLKI